MTNATLDMALIEAATRGDAAGVRLLISQGAEMDQRGNPSGPLFNAAYYGHVEVVQVLLEHGANPDIRNSVNSTPLMGAAEQAKTAVVSLLLAAGADALLENNYKMTARAYAANHSNFQTLAVLDNPPPRRDFRRARLEEVVFTWRVNDRTLQEVFNFEQKERVTLIRKGSEGPVEAVTRDTFEDLGNAPSLRRAFEQYRKQGGTRAESDIFATTLPKLALKRKEP